DVLTIQRPALNRLAENIELPRLLVPAEWIPGQELLAAHGNTQLFPASDRSFEEPVEDHAQVLRNLLNQVRQVAFTLAYIVRRQQRQLLFEPRPEDNGSVFSRERVRECFLLPGGELIFGRRQQVPIVRPEDLLQVPSHQNAARFGVLSRLS